MAKTKDGYELSQDGMRIVSPGKFEGQARWVPFYWNLSLEGDAEMYYSQDGEDSVLRGCSVEIQPEDRTEFPELSEYATSILMVESNEGFVSAVTMDEAALKLWVRDFGS